MKIVFSILLLLFTFQFSFAKSVYTYILRDITYREITNQEIKNNFPLYIMDSLSNRQFYIFDPENEGEDAFPDFVIDANLTFYDEKYEISVKILDMTNKLARYSDSVYTKDLWSNEGFLSAIDSLADRITRIVKGQRIFSYREKKDYRREHARTHRIGNKIYPQSGRIINLVSVPLRYPYGLTYNFPLSFGLEVFQIAFIIFIPETYLGIGFGTKALDIHSTNAGSVLPLTVFMPIYIFPDDYLYSRRDIYLYAEWGYLYPQYSYIDIGIRLYLSSMNFSIGWIMLPEYRDEKTFRPYYETFYIGFSLEFGSYNIFFKEKGNNNAP